MKVDCRACGHAVSSRIGARVRNDRRQRETRGDHCAGLCVVKPCATDKQVRPEEEERAASDRLLCSLNVMIRQEGVAGGETSARRDGEGQALRFDAHLLSAHEGESRRSPNHALLAGRTAPQELRFKTVSGDGFRRFGDPVTHQLM